MVRVENPKLGPGHPMEQLAPWETFQVLGPHHGADISDNTTIKRYGVCVCEREREREREMHLVMGRQIYLLVFISLLE